MDAACNVVRPATTDDIFAMTVQESIATLEKEIASDLDASSLNDDTAASDTDPDINNGGSVIRTEGVGDTLPPVIPSNDDCVDIYWPADNRYYSG